MNSQACFAIDADNIELLGALARPLSGVQQILAQMDAQAEQIATTNEEVAEAIRSCADILQVAVKQSTGVAVCATVDGAPIDRLEEAFAAILRLCFGSTPGCVDERVIALSQVLESS